MAPEQYRLFDDLDGHEQVVACSDERSGLRAFIAIHSTARGPALGGTRFHAYRSDADALRDVLNLSRGMSYKAAMAGLDLGGGKAVIIGDPLTDKTPALLHAYGRFVQSLNGRYYTACDVGTYSEDMDVIAEESRFVTGRTVAQGGAGDSSVLTAYGVFQGMRAAAEATWGAPTLAGRTVGVAGVGKVGHHLVEHLLEDGAQVVVSDVYAPAVARVLEAHPEVAGRGRHRRAGRRADRRLLALRARRRAHRRGRGDAAGQGRVRGREQPARPPRRGEAAGRPRASSTRPTTS